MSSAGGLSLGRRAGEPRLLLIGSQSPIRPTKSAAAPNNDRICFRTDGVCELCAGFRNLGKRSLAGQIPGPAGWTVVVRALIAEKRRDNRIA